MKKLKKNKEILLVGIIFALITFISLFIRFWNYQELVNFFGDPPFFLHEVKDMVESGKPRLVGPMVLSKVTLGRGFFTGPVFYYLLAILGILFNWNVFLITGFFTFLFIGIFGLIFFWLKRRYGQLIALVIYAILSFLPLFIPYSRLMWNPHLLPLFGVLLFWTLEERRRRLRNYLLVGLFFGLGLSAHYSALLWLLIIIYYFTVDLRERAFSFLNWALFCLGTVIAESPFLIFELRHNFYNLRTVIFQIKYFKLSPGYTFNLSYYYYYFSLLPLACKLYAIFLKTVGKNFLLEKIMLFFNLILVLVLLFFSLGPSREVVFYPKGWSIKTQQKVVEMIISDNEENFEVATTIDSDTRAGELRWWLRQKGIKVMAVEDYDKAKILYLVAPKSRPPETESVWEVRTLRPFEIVFNKDLGNGLIFYKLVRVISER